MSESTDALAAELQASLADAYRLERLVGQGGFGRVYRAHDMRLDRPVAIKVIRPDHAGAEVFVERFQREGIALAKLRHPGVVPIYDIRRDGALVYLIMPFIEGETLRARLARRGRLPPKETQRILSELCDALGAAHRMGIVHRDIKPENVILEGTLQKVLLMDFGVSTSRGAADLDEGLLVGTPMYMSPEQVSGDVFIDERSDLYSLGALGYHLLTGSPPFTGNDPRAVMAAHMTATLTPVRQRNPSIPMPLADLVERCLEKDPDYRPASAIEVWRQMQAIEFFPEAEEPHARAVPLVTPIALLFAWSAMASFAAAHLGPMAVEALSPLDWRALGVAFGGAAALASPFVRAVIRDSLGGRAGGTLPHAANPNAAALPPGDGADAAPASASSLFDTLPSDTRRQFADVPSLVRKLEDTALLLRARLEAIDFAIAHAPSGARADSIARLEDERKLVAARLATAAEALESLRLDLMRLTADASAHGELTRAVERAREINDYVGRFLSAVSEVERLTQEEKPIG